ncbi:class I SAM-dependent methyltransferase [Amycolatopsis sp. PS_44_ISF1]|uniref:O-methyltransferase n=1 Tax=Amycolatopsis sp. PS_44_ISF1 TaxID=2974917 RepID=UPI0028DDAAD6|nr:class I SAM-dependent methyltransferase [Amycolatopsis sp. PS_44_ISF1]MDT8914747.1 class I SAM-dependent methyltransferase [Amycolatopsis sp. PS_44_ISF1]
MSAAPPAARPVTPIGILAARLHRLAALLDEAGVSSEIERAVREAEQLAAGLDPYLERHTTPESPALRALAAATAGHDWSGTGRAAVVLEREMLSGHVEGQLLKTLVHLTRARRVLDIGMFTGYSALAMAEALPAGGRVVACELDPAAAAFAAEHFRASGCGGRIEVRIGPAAATLAELGATGHRFDLVFLDADKAGYLGYLATVLERDLLSAHGVVCVDNTLMQGEPWTGRRSPNATAIAEFNAAVAADPRVEQVLLPLRDGVTLIHRVDGR